MRSCYREKIYVCGDYLESHIYPVYKKALSRGKKSKPTKEVQQKLNEIHAENKFVRLCNANFTKYDLKIELTYKPECNPETEEEAARQLRNFLRRLKNYRIRNGLTELKYVAVTERGSRKGRFHHHLIINGDIPLADLIALWGRGIVGTDILQFNENGIADLARYMIKRPIASTKKWNASKNLIHPQARTRDGRLSKRRVVELARDTENAREFEKLYEGYFFSEARKVYNDTNGGVYIYARYYKKEAEFWHTTRRMRK